MKKFTIKNIVYYTGMITITLFFISILFQPSGRKQTTFSIPLDSGGIESIELTEYTAGGTEKRLITSADSIQEIYTYWTKVKIGKETSNRCDDNTKIYKFIYKNGDMISIEKECDNYIQNGRSYEIIEPDN